MQCSRKNVIRDTIRKRIAYGNSRLAMEMCADAAEWGYPVRTGCVSHALQKW